MQTLRSHGDHMTYEGFCYHRVVAGWEAVIAFLGHVERARLLRMFADNNHPQVWGGGAQRRSGDPA